VEGVRCPYPSPLERRRDVVHARCEACLRPVHDGRTLPNVSEPASSVPSSAFVLYRDSALRREALRSPVGDPSRYSLYGLDELARSGLEVHHSLEPRFEPGPGARAKARVLDRAVRLGGGYSGDFARVLASLRELNRADVVFSTVDTVGIPLALLGRFGRVQPPVVYAAIGLPERIAQLRGSRARELFADAFRRLHTVVAYGWGEVEELRSWLGAYGPRVEFVSFGVDTEHFRPDPGVPPEDDVVSVGADPRRDFSLLLELARRRPEWTFRIVASADNAQALRPFPANVRLEVDVPFGRIRECLFRARVVALPVRENTYSGATTTLLQAMACAKPVVVTRTAAIEHGYHLEDGANCRLVPPGDLAALEHAVTGVLDDHWLATGMGMRARKTVEGNLTWTRYTREVRRLLEDAAEGAPVSR
jgi:glycosyltransferase involved in cell wall biosynthesis